MYLKKAVVRFLNFKASNLNVCFSKYLINKKYFILQKKLRFCMSLWEEKIYLKNVFYNFSSKMDLTKTFIVVQISNLNSF